MIPPGAIARISSCSSSGTQQAQIAKPTDSFGPGLSTSGSLRLGLQSSLVGTKSVSGKTNKILQCLRSELRLLPRVVAQQLRFLARGLIGHERERNRLPPREEYDGLDAQEFAEWMNRLELAVRRVIEHKSAVCARGARRSS